MQYLHELAEQLHNMVQHGVETDQAEKIRVMAGVVLETVRTMQSFEDRLRALEERPSELD